MKSKGKFLKFNFCLANKARNAIGFRVFNACFDGENEEVYKYCEA